MRPPAARCAHGSWTSPCMACAMGVAWAGGTGAARAGNGLRPDAARRRTSVASCALPPALPARLQIELSNSSLTLHPSDACTTEVLEGQMSLFQLLTGNADQADVQGQTVIVRNFGATVPVFKPDSGRPGEGRDGWGRRCSLGPAMGTVEAVGPRLRGLLPSHHPLQSVPWLCMQQASTSPAPSRLAARRGLNQAVAALPAAPRAAAAGCPPTCGHWWAWQRRSRWLRLLGACCTAAAAAAAGLAAGQTSKRPA